MKKLREKSDEIDQKIRLSDSIEEREEEMSHERDDAYAEEDVQIGIEIFGKQCVESVQKE